MTAAKGQKVILVGDGGRIVCERCTIADGVVTRARGLLGKRELPAGEGLLLRPTFSIHTFFMRFPIDAVFLDRSGTVIDVVRHLRPWRGATRFRARAVLEVAAGEADRLRLRAGERLRPAEVAT